MRYLRQSQQRPIFASGRPELSRGAIRLRRVNISTQVDGGRNLCLGTDGMRIRTSDETCSRRLHVNARHIRSRCSHLLRISTISSGGKLSRLQVICGSATRI